MAQAFAPLRRLAGLLRHRPDADLLDPLVTGMEESALEDSVLDVEPLVAAPGPDPRPRPNPAVMVDATTRTFWQRGAASAETLVEAGGSSPGASVSRKVAILAAAQPSGSPPAPRAPGPGDPAFVEMTLVEMLRARQFDRAFALLAPECRIAWGSVETFTVENTGAARQLLGAEVQASRRVATWEDADGRIHYNVAELEVDYALAGSDQITTLRRTVHLVRAEGGWRSLVYPAAHRASAA
jgi:hypothetical protein